MDSIFLTVKEALGVEDDESDSTILLNINSALGNLNQLGVGPENGFVITGEEETWVDYLGDFNKLDLVKSYINNKVYLLFYPLANPFLVETIQEKIEGLESSLNTSGDLMDSILLTIKRALGVENDYKGFDTNILLDINNALGTLNQLGVGPENGFAVVGENDTWSDYFGTLDVLESVKSYILCKVRLSFDPPSNSFLIDAIQKQITELEWRLMVKVDPLTIVEEEEEEDE